MGTRKIGGLDIDQEAAIGKTTGAGKITHAIGDNSADLTGGGNDFSSGTHAEGIDSTAVGKMDGELIIGAS